MCEIRGHNVIKWIRGQARLFFMIFALIFSCRISAQEKSPGLRQMAEQRLAERGEVIIRFLKPEDKTLDYLTTYLSIDQVNHDTVIAYVNAMGFALFLSERIPYELMQPPSLKETAKNQNQTTGNWHDHYPSYPVYIALMDSFFGAYPGLCTLAEIGKSMNNHRLLVVRISGPVPFQERVPVVLLTSSIHGDEPLGFYLMLRMIEELLGHYGSDDQIKGLVDSTEIWINPLANPDGTYFVSDNSVGGSTRFNANQVDLNRNFPDPVNGEHPDGNSWQDETIAMMNFMKSIPLQLSVNFHGGSEVVNYPWDALVTLHADDRWYKHIARAYADTVHMHGPAGYMTAQDNGTTNGYQWYPIHGGRQDFVNFYLHGREVTIELSVNKIPAETSLNDFWNYNRNSMIQYIRQALTGVTGKVTDSLTELPVKAMMEIPDHDRDNSEVYSDPADGIFFRLLEAGEYICEISAEGYAHKTMPVSVTHNRLTRLDVTLNPLPVGILYPNPFSDVVKISIAEPGGTAMLEITDLSGRKVRQINHQVVTGGEQEIRVNGLAPGVYFVNLLYRGQVVRQVMVRKSL
jgi:hypothetical protein